MFRAFAHQQRHRRAVNPEVPMRWWQIGQHAVERDDEVTQRVNHGAIQIDDDGVYIEVVKDNRVHKDLIESQKFGPKTAERLE